MKVICKAPKESRRMEGGGRWKEEGGRKKEEAGWREEEGRRTHE